MKILGTILAVFILTGEICAQVIISPYVAYSDQKNKSTSVFITNNSQDPQEIQVSFRFGYPVSDAEGNTIMEYPDSTTQNALDLTKYAKVFPKKFFLEPGEQQTIRVTIKVPVDLPAGTYWTRIVTTSKKKGETGSVSGTQFAKVKLLLSQVTTLIYRNKRYENTLAISDMTAEQIGNELNLTTSCKINGDSPFFADAKTIIYNSNSNAAVMEIQEYFSIFGSIKRRSTTDISSLAPGNYHAEVQIISNQRKDIPLSDSPLNIPVKKIVHFTVK